MKRFAAVVLREVAEWRLPLLLSALAGALPLLAPSLPQLARHSPQEVRAGVVLVLIGLFGLVFLLLFGSTMVGRDLAERRLGFYLARPIGGHTLWLAKLGAAWLLLVLCLGLIALPAALVDGRQWLESPAGDVEGSKASPPIFGTSGAEYFFGSSWASLPDRLLPTAGLLQLAVWLAFGLAWVHGLSTFLRSRSSMLVFDLAAAAVVALMLFWAWSTLLGHQALAPMVWWSRSIGPLALLVIVVAGGRQLSLGRIDLGRGHRVFSATLWPGLLVLALATALWARWVVTPDLDDLVLPQVVEPAPDGPWLLVGGPTRWRAGAASAFLLDTESGQSWRLGGLDVSAWWSSFSADGSRVVWPRCHRLSPLECTLWQIARGEAEPRDSGIVLASYTARLDLSDDGRHVALAQNNQVEVYDLASGRLLVSSKMDTRDLRSLQLTSAEPTGETLRVAVGEEVDDGVRVVLQELDLATLRSSEVGTLPDLVMGYRACRGGGVEHLLLSTLGPPRFLLADGATGEIRHALEPPQPEQWRCLADGRVVLARHQHGAGVWLMVLGPDGQELARHALPSTESFILGSEIEPGQLLLGLGEGGAMLGRLDVASGLLTPLLEGLAPLLASNQYHAIGEVAVGSPASRLLQASDGSLWRLDPASGQPERLLGPFPATSTGDLFGPGERGSSERR